MRIPINDDTFGAVFNNGSKLCFILLDSDYYFFGVKDTKGHIKMSYSNFKRLINSIKERKVKIDYLGTQQWQFYPDCKPSKYGKYQVMLFDGTVSKITWNGTGWAYFNSQIIKWK